MKSKLEDGCGPSKGAEKYPLYAPRLRLFLKAQRVISASTALLIKTKQDMDAALVHGSCGLHR